MKIIFLNNEKKVMAKNAGLLMTTVFLKYLQDLGNGYLSV